MKPQTLLLLCCCLWGYLPAQMQSLMAVSLDGAAVCETPADSLHPMAVIPFGETVQMLPDTGAEHAPAGWYAVSWQGKQGYARRQSLIAGPRIKSMPRSDWYLIPEAPTCDLEFLNLPELPHQYAVYDRGRGWMVLEPVRLDYQADYDLDESGWLDMHSDQPEEAVFYLITAQPLQTGIIPGQSFHNASLSAQYNRLYLEYAPYQLRLWLVPDTLQPTCARYLFTQIGKKIQLLDAFDPERDPDLCRVESCWLTWAGDLDGDGRTDILLGEAYAQREPIHEVLWLSSMAREDEQVRRGFSIDRDPCRY